MFSSSRQLIVLVSTDAYKIRLLGMKRNFFFFFNSRSRFAMWRQFTSGIINSCHHNFPPPVSCSNTISTILSLGRFLPVMCYCVASEIKTWPPIPVMNIAIINNCFPLPIWLMLIYKINIEIWSFPTFFKICLDHFICLADSLRYLKVSPVTVKVPSEYHLAINC